eukprot:196391-Amphidinium_carterae.1
MAHAFSLFNLGNALDRSTWAEYTTRSVAMREFIFTRMLQTSFLAERPTLKADWAGSKISSVHCRRC